MKHLSPVHKGCLKELVKLVRENSIPEEFHITYDGNGPLIVPAPGTDGYLHMTGLTTLGLEALTQAGFLFSKSAADPRMLRFMQPGSTETSRTCYITPSGYHAVDNDFALAERIVNNEIPVEISHSLAAFRCDFPDPSRLAFVMMQFDKSIAHANIHKAIRSALEPHHYIALRADDKEYHEDIFFNILTYVYGCRFGIAVFERISDESFNPNVSLEVGYMRGIGKEVCYLKDRTLKTLQTDLIGKLYREFDSHDCQNTLSQSLLKWMKDKDLLVEKVAASNLTQ